MNFIVNFIDVQTLKNHSKNGLVSSGTQISCSGAPPPPAPIPPYPSWSRFMTWRLIVTASLTTCLLSLIILPFNYFAPALPPALPPPPIDDMVSLSEMIGHCTFVKTDFRWFSLWPRSQSSGKQSKFCDITRLSDFFWGKIKRINWINVIFYPDEQISESVGPKTFFSKKWNTLLFTF